MFIFKISIHNFIAEGYCIVQIIRMIYKYIYYALHLILGELFPIWTQIEPLLQGKYHTNKLYKRNVFWGHQLLIT